MRKKMVDFVHGLQDEICAGLSELDDSSFREDSWERPGGGGGRSRVIQDGSVFEKAGVNVSVVHGELSDRAVASMGGGKGADDEARAFFATGISLVLHPRNPMAPTVHANYRYFERGDGQTDGHWWFGGGADLTPAYLFDEDAAHFHQTLKRVCDDFDLNYYPRFKKWCDDYFFIKHRGESRGVGGLFFDDLHDRPKDEVFQFVRGCGESFLNSYLPIIQRRKDTAFDEAHRHWQQIRRGRYVEFNLVYDRGTTFGLQTDGRIESILMSLPLTSRWEYCHSPAEGSEEARLVEVLKTPQSWAR
ncbi:MAG: oxygen-dependent coproporphyrinogen oxidase [Myxococcota bacterium]|nr:oxygen-dependent coproporphyrinogen oxidase [Myxococcota bacterium]